MKKSSAKRIRVKVVRHLPSGLSVEMEDGWHGIIRKGEISWDQEKRLEWKKLYPVGFEGWAIQIQAKSRSLPELSLRLAENDPWERISQDLDKIHVGVVTGVMEYGVFIKLESGITGLLHESQLPSWIKKTPLKLFWPGDRVKVVIKEVDREKRRLGLGFPQENTPVVAEKQLLDPILTPTRAKIDDLIKDKTNRKRILVVDDNPKQANLVLNWLRRVGQRAQIANNAEEALSAIEKVSPDIALIDVELPGMDGVALANLLLKEHPQMQLVVTTDYASADKRNQDLELLQERGVDFLPKPLIPDDMLDFLKKNGKYLEPTQVQKADSVPEIKDEPGLEDALPTDSIHELLQNGRSRLGYEAAILFQLDPVRRTVSIVESSSQVNLNEYAIPSLIYSPVRDIAEDKEVIMQEDILAGDEARFQYLLDLISVKACIGLPIPIHLPQKYALMFLSISAKEIYKEDLVYAEAISLIVRVSLEQAAFREKYTSLQRAALIGQLTSAVIHETNNLIGPISNRLEYFTDNLEMLISGKMSAGKVSSLSTELDNLKKDTNQIVTTMRMLGRTIAKDKEEVFRLDEIINEAIYLMQETANKVNVTLALTSPEKLLVVRSQSAALHQILLNLLLNATQQIAEFRAELGGVVQVLIESDDVSSPNSAIRISIRDNGPGIHASLWETIFELGYSTRKDGSGIGLYISKSLAEEKLKGQLFVQESYILGGTTVTLEIPHQL